MAPTPPESEPPIDTPEPRDEPGVHDPAVDGPAVGDAFDDPIDEGPTDADPASEASVDDEALSEALGDLDPDADADDRPAGGKRKPHAVLCPYCGHTQRKRTPASGTAQTAKSRAERCDTCGGLFEPLSRKATQIAMGPWFLRDKRNPFRPGCSFEVVEKLIKIGQINPTTVVRGPTTRQFWSIARNVPGIAHRLGYCHACGGRFEPDRSLRHCPFCETEFKTPRHRNELGLAYPNRKAAESAQRSLDRQLALLTGQDMVGIDPDGEPIDHHPDPPPEPEKPAAEAPAAGPQKAAANDLLGDVLGIDAPPAERAEDVSALDFTPDDAQPNEESDVGLPSPAPEPRAAAPIAPPHPNQLSPVQPAQPWVIYLLVALNVIVGLGILAYFLFRPA